MTDFTIMRIDENGGAYWATNGKYIPDECAREAAELGYPVSIKETAKRRAEQDEEFFQSYRERMKNYEPSEEEMFEMRAAFGTGTTIVDVITGKEIRL